MCVPWLGFHCGLLFEVYSNTPAFGVVVVYSNPLFFLFAFPSVGKGLLKCCSCNAIRMFIFPYFGDLGVFSLNI